MADTVWSQIGGIFYGFFRSMSLFVVFTVFTSLMSLFLVISFQTPLKNPTRRAGGTKASGFVPFEGGYNKKVQGIWEFRSESSCLFLQKYPSEGFLKPMGAPQMWSI